MVDRDSEEAEVIRKYVKNTHATTHNAYDLEVMDVRMLFPFLFLFFEAQSVVLAVLKLAVRPGWPKMSLPESLLWCSAHL